MEKITAKVYGVTIPSSVWSIGGEPGAGAGLLVKSSSREMLHDSKLLNLVSVPMQGVIIVLQARVYFLRK